MKILYFTCHDPYSDKKGGSSLSTLALRKEFNKDLFKSGLVLNSREKPNIESDYNLKLPKSKIMRKLILDYFNPRIEKEILGILKDFNPDLIHFNNIYGFPVNTINKIAKIYPVIITIREHWIFEYSLKLPTFINNIHKNIALKKLKNILLVAPSKFIYKKLENAGYKKIKLIYNSVDMPFTRTSYEKTIIYCGRISPEKGLQTIIGILDKIENYRTLILGEGPMKKILQGSYKNIKFLGFQNPEKYYQKSSILVMPSIWDEPFGRSTLEAMSYGLCVIGSKTGGTPELIIPCKTGLLFDPGNADDFEKKLNYLLENPEKIKLIGHNASDFIKKNYNYKEMIQNYKETYQETIALFKKMNNTV
jgi:glycosyltransferase involved in cell wall biosynthesis